MIETSDAAADARRAWQRRRLALASLCLWMHAAGPAAAQAPPPTGQPVPYTVEIDGVQDPDLAELMRATSQLVQLRERQPASQAGLERRAERDVERLDTVLRARGYYDGAVTFRTEPRDQGTLVVIDVRTGPRYTLKEYAITYTGPAAVPEELRRPAVIGLQIGMSARSDAIVTAQRQLLTELARVGFPYASVAGREALVDHDDRTMAVRLDVAQGPRVTFGDVRIEGLETVDENYVRRLSSIERGAVYDQRVVDRTRNDLTGTGLFGNVDVARGEAPAEDGPVPVTIRVEEQEHRTVSFGVGYSSADGPRADVSWEHRNLLGEDENLRLTLRGAQLEQSAKASFRSPNYGVRDQTLYAETELRRSTTDAYDETAILGGIGLERVLDDNWTISGGLAPEYSEQVDRDETRTYFIIGVPLGVRYDNTDSLLDPTRGFRGLFEVTPYYVTLDEPSTFTKLTLGGSTYARLDKAGRFVVAGRARIGSIFGADRDTVPANKRFYAGGGGSVRGYAYQIAGPLDETNDPIGGRSVLEVGAEVRIKITEEIGLVPFIDGGSAFGGSIADGSEPFLWAAGLGARYYTAVGPMRVDVAFPLNGREDIDDVFQFYVSLGQAF